MNIRPAILEDEADVFRLARAMATSFLVNREAFAGLFREVQGSDSCDLLVVEVGKEIVGYVYGLHHPAFYANGKVSWVEEIFVEEARRRQGLGLQLMSAFENCARARGSRLVGLATRRAANFYRAVGYEQSATYFRKVLVPEESVVSAKTSPASPSVNS